MRVPSFGGAMPSRTSSCALCCVCMHAHTEQYVASAITLRRSANDCRSSFCNRHAAIWKMQAKYWRATIVPIMQLSH